MINLSTEKVVVVEFSVVGSLRFVDAAVTVLVVLPRYHIVLAESYPPPLPPFLFCDFPAPGEGTAAGAERKARLVMRREAGQQVTLFANTVYLHAVGTL